jgi:hypothetical protein
VIAKLALAQTKFSIRTAMSPPTERSVVASTLRPKSGPPSEKFFQSSLVVPVATRLTRTNPFVTANVEVASIPVIVADANPISRPV